MKNEFNELNAKKLELQNAYYEFQYMDISKEGDLRTLRFLKREIESLMEDIFYLECINFIEGGRK